MIYEFDNLYDGVVKQAQRYGDKDRYIYKVKKEERHFTFNDMLAHVNYISSAMTRLGVAIPIRIMWRRISRRFPAAA